MEKINKTIDFSDELENIKKDILKIPLGPEIGQCCGGNVEVSLVIMSKKNKSLTLNSFNENYKTLPHVYVMGSGHVGRALALQFQVCTKIN